MKTMQRSTGRRIAITIAVLASSFVAAQYFWRMNDEEAALQLDSLGANNKPETNRVIVIQAYRLASYLRLKYAFKSVRSRLSTELPATKRNQEQLLTLVENPPELGFLSRTEALQIIHEQNVVLFILAPGNGLSRVPRPTAEYLGVVKMFDRLDTNNIAFTPDPGIPLGDPYDLPQDDAELIPFPFNSPTAIASIDSGGWLEEKAAENEKLIPSVSFIKSTHRFSVDQFLQEARMGYARSIDEVAGFLPHGVFYAPDLDSYFQPRASRLSDKEPLTVRMQHLQAMASWKFTRIELLSLLKPHSPAVYVSSELPNMEKLVSAPIRQLDKFEVSALEQLWKGEYVVIDSYINRIQMLGAIRASKSCLTCHAVQEGELLGAFSYRITRSVPYTDK